MAKWFYRNYVRNALRRGLIRLVLLLAVLGGGGYGLRMLDQQGVFGTRHQADWDTYHNKTFLVVKAVDGDTIDIAWPDGKYPHTRLRLWGVDTPETVKPNHPVEHYGLEASGFTRRLTRNQRVRLELVPNRTRDKYGRLLAYVYVPEKGMLNLRLIQTGHGYADPRFVHPHKKQFAAEMKSARQAKRGLWKHVKRSDLPYYLKSGKR